MKNKKEVYTFEELQKCMLILFVMDNTNSIKGKNYGERILSVLHVVLKYPDERVDQHINRLNNI